MWRADLRPFGLKKIQPWPWGVDLRGWLPGFENLAFASDGIVIASFATPESKALLSPRRVHVVLLDAAKGTVLGTREWSVRRSEVGLFATHDGKFFVRTDDRPPGQELRSNQKIVLYSGKLEPLKEFALPPGPNGEFELWHVYVTPTRQSIVVEHGVGRGREVQWLDRARGIDVRWLDPDTLEPKATWAWTAPKTPDRLYTDLHISDSWIVATFRVNPNFLSGEKGSCDVSVRTIDGPWRLLFRSDSCPSGAEFVNKDTVLFTGPGNIYLFQVDGRPLLDERLGKNEFAHVVRPSANGRRFAIAVATTKGGSALLDISPHEVLKRIIVYDIPSQRWVFTLDGKHVNLKYVGGFALSPDGFRLAVMRDGVVELYELPN